MNVNACVSMHVTVRVGGDGGADAKGDNHRGCQVRGDDSDGDDHRHTHHDDAVHDERDDQNDYCRVQERCWGRKDCHDAALSDGDNRDDDGDREDQQGDLEVW